MELIQQNLLIVKKRILSACKKFGKDEKKITVIAVSKKQSIFLIKQAINFGQNFFGENYVQEGLEKIQKLNYYKNIKWHFIGKIQSNKIKFISKNFSWCQTIDNFKVAKKLNETRPINLKPLNVLIQVNINNEKNKPGVSIDTVKDLAKEITEFPKLKLRGLMAIPKTETNYEKQRLTFFKISKLMFSLKQLYLNCDTLSLGTSNEIENAIEAGSNMLRIGTSIFGTRPYLSNRGSI